MLSALLLTALLLQDPFPPPPPEGEIRVDEVIDVELQQLYVTVTRPSGSAVLDLARTAAVHGKEGVAGASPAEGFLALHCGCEWPAP